MVKRMEWQNKKESNEHYNLESWENEGKTRGVQCKQQETKMKGRKNWWDRKRAQICAGT